MKAKTVELHLLQSFPPSCVNRDGNNSPKDCTFGGYRRARISSQCLKRAIRQAPIFREIVEEVGVRSKHYRDRKVIPLLSEMGWGSDAEAIADVFLTQLAKPEQKDEGLTSVGLYFGDAELRELLRRFVEEVGIERIRTAAAKKGRTGEDDESGAADKGKGRKNEKGKIEWAPKSVSVCADVALFGRMLAEATNLNVDAAAQVAHAISTHRLSQEMDYWTAVDDLKDASAGEDAGAAMLGTAEFNASVFYRYACVSLPILVNNLGDEEMARKTVEAFLLASYDAIPSGKLNGHAHFNPPLFALAVVRRRGMPLNLCNAFQEPVRPEEGRDLSTVSAQRLLDHLARMRAMVPTDEAFYAYAHALAPEPQNPCMDVGQLEGYRRLVSRVLEEI